ncbi:5-formyltetrahydrofolate cyclo-ligase [Maritalea mediterranea]|uniref:5-formyltetrahydrofolate cyclo-ligase n=1 Tax=Maritalea mediterranea TaxID=2909667 RepID=A0ABS9EA71_9HYPH|nr:5-formyltetrahydrofolate cyclo-ligase [Maritalea mediterranea]MCF4099777.1 5-formyltetrahydrofolate cyclo-ligase [Maritalea mediterranea]
MGEKPCFSEKIIGGHVVDPQTMNDVAVFRRSERQRLYEQRKCISPDARNEASIELSSALDKVIGDVSGLKIAANWPIRGEFDLRDWMRDCHVKGASIALPVVKQKNAPVEFHEWQPETKMKLGHWRIPVPYNEHPISPDVVVVPLLGFDKAKYRLGNGGGYYDRTLAQMDDRTKVIGVGYTQSAMDTIFPMPWDIAMDVIVLDDGQVF